MYYIVLSSITYATWLKRLFVGYGSTVAMVHTPGGIPVGGCSYSIRTTEKLFREVADAARQARMKILGVYKESDGEFVEVKP